MNNLKQTFEVAGSSLDNVVKAQVFMTDLKNFAAFDEVWKEFFKVPPTHDCGDHWSLGQGLPG
ncbi:MAG: RidA family protein [Rhodomicrobium sp.]